MKKRLMCAAVSLMLLAGCGSEPAPEEKTGTVGRLPITMMYSSELKNFEKLVEDTYPDIDLRVEINAEATIDGESERRLRSGHGTDIVTTNMPTGNAKDYVMDLSAMTYASKYQAGITKSLQIDGRTHFIPMPGKYSGYIYNVSMAEQAGADIAPADNGALLAMMDKVSGQGLGKEDLDNVMFAFSSMDLPTVSAYFIGTQIPDFLGLADGVTWRQKLTTRESGFADGMSHSIDVVSAMAERGYIDPSRLTGQKGNATPVLERMLNGTMFITYGTIDFFNTLNGGGGEYEFAMLPFLSDKGNHPWTMVTPAAFLGINADLGEKGNEKKLDAADRILSLLSSEEGQKAVIADGGAAQSYLNGMTADAGEVPPGLADCVENGYIYNLQFPAKLLQYFGNQMIASLNGEMTVDEALANVDNYFVNGDEEVEYDHTLVGVMADDLIFENYNTRREETAVGNLVSDAVKEMTGADIALVNGGSVRSSLYKGNVFGYDLDAVCPYPNEVVVLKTDGATVKSALANGITLINQDSGIPGGRFLNVAGLCYTFRAPTEDSPAELLDVTLPDGSPLNDNDTFTVAMTGYMAGQNGYNDNNGDGYVMFNIYSDTTPPAKNVELIAETGRTFTDALQLYFENHANEAITAKLEGRIKVVSADER